MSYKQNYLKAAKFEDPDYIPCNIVPTWPIWNTYREKLEDIAKRYSILFPWYKPGAITFDWFRPYSRIEYHERPGIVHVDEYRYDAFGCLWRTKIKGYIGEVIKHPLDEWSKLKEFKLPDPEVGVPTESGDSKAIISWNEIFSSMEKARSEGELVVAWLPHGFLFQRLMYLRDYRNLILDFYRDEPRLRELITMLTEYYLKLINIYKKFGRVDAFCFGDDLGTQKGPMIRPQHFKKYLYDSYEKIFKSAKSIAEIVRFHTDGDIITLSNYLLELSIDVLNIQDKVNGLENIAKIFKGKKAIEIDIDRQYLIPYGTPEEIDKYIKYVIDSLVTPRGGLMIYAEVHPPTPLENIEALAKSLIKYIKRYSKLTK
jgi:hypothetical protein